MKRGLSYAEAITYVGVKRRTFDVQWRPLLVAMNQGTSVVFDREELDRLFEEFKRQSADELARTDGCRKATPGTAQNRVWNGRPIVKKGARTWAERQGVSTPVRTEPGKSTGSPAARDFASAASEVLRKRSAG